MALANLSKPFAELSFPEKTIIFCFEGNDLMGSILG